MPYPNGTSLAKARVGICNIHLTQCNAVVLHHGMLSKDRSESSNTNMCLHDSLGSEHSRRKTHGASGMKSGTLSTIVHSPNSK